MTTSCGEKTCYEISIVMEYVGKCKKYVRFSYIINLCNRLEHTLTPSLFVF